MREPFKETNANKADISSYLTRCVVDLVFLSRTVYKDVDVIGKNKKHRDNIKLNVTTKWLVSVLCRRSGLVLENLTGS